MIPFKNRFKLFLILFMCLNVYVFSEGTKELRPNQSNKGYIQLDRIWSDFALYNAGPDDRLHIRICNAGEKIYYGFKQTSNDVEYRIKDPLGNIVVGPSNVPSTGAGYIPSYAKAVAGPAQIVGTGGYDALSYTTTMTGDYYIEFKNTTSNGRRDFEYFDITVAGTANTIIKGRLWSKAWQFVTRSFTSTFNGKLYIYSDDGIVTSIDFNGMQPYTFVISANETGCVNTGNITSDRKSRSGNVNYPRYKVFLNDPDSSCFPTGTFGTLTAQPALIGCNADSFCLSLDADKAGIAEIFLELNGIPGHQPMSKDVFIYTTVSAGPNCIPWDGKDGLGNSIMPGTSISFTINYCNGLTHLPIYDVEDHRQGFIVSLVRPAGANPLLFWDDSNLTGGSAQLAGCSNPTGCHSWPSTGFGNFKTINTWWYAHTQTITSQFIVDLINVDAASDNDNNTISICPTDSAVQLNGNIVSATGGKWNSEGTGTFFPDDSTLSAVYILSSTDISSGVVTLTLSSTGNGFCDPVTDIVTITISVCPEDENEYVFYIPNSFTPNGDGINDFFSGKGDLIKEYEMYIFNRWGNIVFYTNDITKSWNGTYRNLGDQEIIQQDVYSYLINIVDFIDEQHQYRGHVSLIR